MCFGEKSRLSDMKIKYSFLGILFLVGCSSDPNVKYAKSVETGAQLCFIENNKFQVGHKWENPYKANHVNIVSLHHQLTIHCNNGEKWSQDRNSTIHLEVNKTKWLPCSEHVNFCKSEQK